MRKVLARGNYWISWKVHLLSLSARILLTLFDCRRDRQVLKLS